MQTPSSNSLSTNYSLLQDRRYLSKLAEKKIVIATKNIASAINIGTTMHLIAVILLILLQNDYDNNNF